MHTQKIQELFSKDQSSLLDILISSLKDKVSIDPASMKPSLSFDLLKMKPKEKCLYYLLGQCVLRLSDEAVDSDQNGHGISAATAKTELDLSKGEADGAFYSLRNDKLIERCGNDNKQVMYRIPNHRILEVLRLLKIEDGLGEDTNKGSRSKAAESKETTDKESTVSDDHEYVTRDEFDQILARVEKLENERRYPNSSTTIKAETIREFFLKKQPKNNIEKTICVVYFLEMVKGTTEGLTSSEVRYGIQQAREKVPPNISQDLIRCNEKGWVDLLRKENGKAYWTITNSGIDFVEQPRSES